MAHGCMQPACNSFVAHEAPEEKLIWMVLFRSEVGGDTPLVPARLDKKSLNPQVICVPLLELWVWQVTTLFLACSGKKVAHHCIVDIHYFCCFYFCFCFCCLVWFLFCLCLIILILFWGYLLKIKVHHREM